jgi:hypothetical protein
VIFVSIFPPKIIELREKEKSERLKALLDPKAAWGDDTTPVDVGPPAQEPWAAER